MMMDESVCIDHVFMLLVRWGVEV